MTNYRVLIVEDSPTMNRLVSHAVNGIPGVSSVSAADGFQALRKIVEDRYDLVITDINMPMLDGFKLVARIRDLHRTIPIVVLTAEDAAEDRDQAVRLGANYFLTKPVQSQDVKRVCIEALGLAPP